MKRLVFVIWMFVPMLLHSQMQWKVKEDASEVRFKIKNFGVWVEGSFGGLKADINFDPSSPEKGAITASVEVNTINTGINSRDSHLKKEEYFDAEKYPKITIKSTSITKEGDQFILHGKLTMKATTKDISFSFVFGEVEGKAVFRAEFEINRNDYGIGGSGGPMGDTVKLTLSVPVTRQ